MFQPRSFSLPFAFSLCLVALSIITVATPLTPSTPSPKASAKASQSDAAAAFQMVVPAELQQKVTVEPSWLPLSKQLASLQDATKVPLTRARSVPDDPLFVAAPNRSEFALLRQMRLLLTDDRWRNQWANKKLGEDHSAYRLWREAVSPQERRAKMAQAAKDRLAKVLALIQAGPAAWDAARGDDPDLSNNVRQPMYQAPILLASELAPDALDSVLAGNPLSLRVADLSPQDQALVAQSLSARPLTGAATIRNNITGQVRVVFDPGRIATAGEVVFQAEPLNDDPGTLDLSMRVYTDPAHEAGVGSNGILYPKWPELTDEKEQIINSQRENAAHALAAETPGAKMVTIDAGARPEPGEPPLAAYLRAFAEQTKLTVLAHWPSDSKTLTDSQGLPKGLPASIVNKPAGEALDILCKTYGGEWVQDEMTVRLRALPDKEPVVKKPAPSPPTATAIPAPAAPVNSGPSR